MFQARSCNGDLSSKIQYPSCKICHQFSHNFLRYNSWASSYSLSSHLPPQSFFLKCNWKCHLWQLWTVLWPPFLWAHTNKFFFWLTLAILSWKVMNLWNPPFFLSHKWGTPFASSSKTLVFNSDMSVWKYWSSQLWSRSIYLFWYNWGEYQ